MYLPPHIGLDADFARNKFSKNKFSNESLGFRFNADVHVCRCSSLRHQHPLVLAKNSKCNENSTHMPVLHNNLITDYFHFDF